jgi:hypothetical protein
VVLWYVITHFKSIFKELDGETMDNKILTAEDFIQEHLEISHFYDDKTNRMVCFSEDVQQVMIEFAKLHVQSALESASENVETNYYYVENDPINKESIINSYPLDLIK